MASAVLSACAGGPLVRRDDAGLDAIDAPVAASDTGDSPPPVDMTPGALPDLTVDPGILQQNIQFAVQFFRPDSCELLEHCVNAPGWRRLLMFTTFTPNIGNADLDLGTPNASNHNFMYSDCHHHWHFQGYADYSLRTGDGGVAAAGHKQSFCVEDLVQVTTDDPTIRTMPQFLYCGDGNGRQGISQGWADDYYPDLPCQWIDVTDVAPGSYTLRVDLNTAHAIVESDYTNNSAEASVRIPAQWNGANPLAACVSGGPDQGIGRECGWVFEGSHSCTPGDVVSVGCNARCGLGCCVGSWDLRVCEGTTTCNGADLQRVLQQDFGECSTGVYDLASTCPVATFLCPPSGNYSVMQSPDAYGDHASSCHLETRVIPMGNADAGGGDASSDASQVDDCGVQHPRADVVGPDATNDGG